MAESKSHPEVEAFFSKPGQWQEAFNKLRAIVLACPLEEELKWGHPCYTFQHQNVVLIHGFKEYCALLFHKGSLMKDPKGILIQQTANVQAGRQIRFTSAQEIVKMKAVLKSYVEEAIAVEQAGLKVNFKKTTEFDMPEEFQAKLDAMPDLKAAFEALTPGRQRAYLLHFSAAKQAKTRVARVEKYLPQILAGKGLDD